MPNARPLPFEVSFEEVRDNLGPFVETIFDALESDFLIIPRGEGFIDSDAFSQGYAALLDATDGFSLLDPDRLYIAVQREPLALVVLRSILGLTPPEWADIATLASDIKIDQGQVRSLDRAIRRNPTKTIGNTPLQEKRIRALIQSGCDVLGEPAPKVEEDEIHRLDKIDTRQGLDSVRRVAEEGVWS